MKKTTGWLGTIFGSLGTLISVLLIVATWMVWLNINSAISQSTARIESGLRELQGLTLNFNDTIEGSRDSLKQFNDQIDADLARFSLEVALPEDYLAPLHARTNQIATRLRNWKELIGIIEELFLLVEELFQSLPGAAAPAQETRQPVLAALKSGQQHLDSAVTAIEELPELLEKLESDEGRSLVRSLIQPKIDQIDQALVETLAGSEAFSLGIKRLYESVIDARTRIKKLTFLGASLGTLLLIWFGAGQVCLAQTGWRQLKPEQTA